MAVERESRHNRFEIIRPERLVSSFQDLEFSCGLFGAVKGYDWRGNDLLPWSNECRVPFYDPVIKDREWEPKDAVSEAHHLAHDVALVLPVFSEAAFASTAELGCAALSAILRGQELGILIQEDGVSDPDAQRARQLLSFLVQNLHTKFPVFTLNKNMEELRTWVFTTMGRLRPFFDKSCMIHRVTTIDLKNNNLRSKQPKVEVGIFGTSVEGARSRREQMGSKLANAGISFFDSMKPDWTPSDIVTEFEYKTQSPITLIPITQESNSLGILAELPWLIIYSMLNNTKLAYYIEDVDSKAMFDSFRTRTLVNAHLDATNKQFPGLCYKAKSFDELTAFAIHHAKSKRRR